MAGGVEAVYGVTMIPMISAIRSQNEVDHVDSTRLRELYQIGHYDDPYYSRG